MTGDEIGHRAAGAFVGHMLDFDAGLLPEILRHQMALGAVAGRTIGDRTRLAACQCDQFLDVLHRQARMHRKHGRRPTEQRDMREVLHRVIGQLGQQRRQHMRGYARNHQVVAIRCAACDQFRTDRATGTGAVLHHELLLELFGQFLRHDAAQGIGTATSAKRRHDADRFGRPVGCAALGLDCHRATQQSTDKQTARPARQGG